MHRSVTSYFYNRTFLPKLTIIAGITSTLQCILVSYSVLTNCRSAPPKMSAISRGFIEVENITVELHASWASHKPKTFTQFNHSQSLSAGENHVSNHESGYLFSTRALVAR